MKKTLRNIGIVAFNVFCFNGLAFTLGLSFGWFDMGFVGGLFSATFVLMGLAFATDQENLDAFKTIVKAKEVA